MSYDPDFLIFVNLGDMEYLSNIVSSTLPDAQQVLVGNIATAHNQIFIKQNTLYDPTDNSSESSRYRFEVVVFYMAQRPITEDVMQNQANIAKLLTNTFEEKDIEFILISHDLDKFMET
jgi:hypothetical protein